MWKDENVSNLFLLAGTSETGESIGGDFSQYTTACPLNFTTSGTYGFQYYFDYPATSPFARFVFVNPNITSTSHNYTVGGPSYVWLEGVLADARASGMNWIVVNMHKIFITGFAKTSQVESVFFFSPSFSSLSAHMLHGHM